MTPERLLDFATPLVDDEHRVYFARACGALRSDGKWEGWIEFTTTGDSRVLRTGRETTQPNRPDLVYWATGLTGVYLEGALDRAMDEEERGAREVSDGTDAAASSNEPEAPPSPRRRFGSAWPAHSAR